jgi:hypothetical protein
MKMQSWRRWKFYVDTVGFKEIHLWRLAPGGRDRALILRTEPQSRVSALRVSIAWRKSEQSIRQRQCEAWAIDAAKVRAQSRIGDARILRIEFDKDRIQAHAIRDKTNGAGPAEGIKDGCTFWATGDQAALDECGRKGREMRLAESGGRHMPNFWLVGTKEPAVFLLLLAGHGVPSIIEALMTARMAPLFVCLRAILSTIAVEIPMGARSGIPIIWRLPCVICTRLFDCLTVVPKIPALAQQKYFLMRDAGPISSR